MMMSLLLVGTKILVCSIWRSKNGLFTLMEITTLFGVTGTNTVSHGMLGNLPRYIMTTTFRAQL